jgi:hypothetical protein
VNGPHVGTGQWLLAVRDKSSNYSCSYYTICPLLSCPSIQGLYWPSFLWLADSSKGSRWPRPATQGSNLLNTALNGRGIPSMAKKMTSTNRVRSVSLDIGAKESRGVGWADGAFRGVDAGLSSPTRDCSTGWPQVNAKMRRLWAVRRQPRRRYPEGRLALIQESIDRLMAAVSLLHWSGEAEPLVKNPTSSPTAFSVSVGAGLVPGLVLPWSWWSGP